MFNLQLAPIKPSGYRWFSSHSKLECSPVVTYLRRKFVEAVYC